MHSAPFREGRVHNPKGDTMPKISTRDSRAIGSAMAKGEDFQTHGAITGKAGKPSSWDAGRLPSEWVDSFLGSDYAVYSYATPIAWRDAKTGRWVEPGVRYSVTTTRHMGTVCSAMWWARGTYEVA